jgi:hypothetical protein
LAQLQAVQQLFFEVSQILLDDSYLVRRLATLQLFTQYAKLPEQECGDR